MDENKLETQPAVLRATIQIKRAATGKVETYEIVGTAEPQPQPQQENTHVGDAPHGLS